MLEGLAFSRPTWLPRQEVAVVHYPFRYMRLRPGIILYIKLDFS